MQITEFSSIVRLDEIVKAANQKITVLEVSARDGCGLQDVARWIQDNAKPNPAS